MLMGLAGLVLFIGLWKSAQYFEWMRPGTVPDPLSLPAALLAEVRTDRLLPAIGSSMIHYVWGLALGSLAGVLVGFLVATSRIFDELQGWIARILRPIPPLAWVIFAIAWFQVSHAGAAFVISIGVFWVNYFATSSAIRNLDPRLDELARAFGHGTFLRRHWTVTLPGAAPGIF
jgi:NitT/TauT family transport system permease protein